MAEAQRLRESASPTPSHDGEIQGVSRSVLEWDPLSEEYKRRMEPIDSFEEQQGIGSGGSIGRKYSSAGFDDFSDHASRMSDIGGNTETE